MSINLDSINAHTVQAWLLMGGGILLIAAQIVPAEISGALFGMGITRLERLLEKPSDKQ
jgi:hypothetical protein